VLGLSGGDEIVCGKMAEEKCLLKSVLGVGAEERTLCRGRAQVGQEVARRVGVCQVAALTGGFS